MFFLEKENGKNQDSVFLAILGRQENIELFGLGRGILRQNMILLYIENIHEFGKKEAINPPTGGFLRFAKNYDKISP